MAVSASRARFLIQFLFLYEILYLRPLFSSVTSSSENWMSVLFTIVGANVSLESGSFCCFVCKVRSVDSSFV
jgi:hypothetical protein